MSTLVSKGYELPVGGGQTEDHACSPPTDTVQKVRKARHSGSVGEDALPGLGYPGGRGGGAVSPPGSPATSPPTSPEFSCLGGSANTGGTSRTHHILDAQEQSLMTGETSVKKLRHEPEMLYLNQDMDPAVVRLYDLANQQLTHTLAADVRGQVSRLTDGPGLGTIPSCDFLLILVELEAADLASVECVAKELCWPDGLGKQSLPEEAAHQKVRDALRLLRCALRELVLTRSCVFRSQAIHLGLTDFRRDGESWKQTLARAERSGYRNRLSAGWRHTSLVHPTGGLFSWGNMGSGRLGIEAAVDKKHLPSPTLVSNLPPGITQISAGVNHSLMLTDAGAVYCCGYSAYASPVGQPGEWEDDTSYHKPQPIPVLTNFVKVKAVSAGPMHSAAVTDLGQVFSWGFGRFGMLGHGTTDASQDPKLVTALPPAHQISCGGLFTAVVTTAGELWTFGTGYIGHGCRSFEQHTPLKVGGLDGVNVAGVSCGKDHLALVTECGAMYTFGIGRDGRLGHGSVETERTPRRLQGIGLVEQVACGKAHTAALLRTGALLTFGCGGNGRLGHGGDENQHTPKLVEALAHKDCIEVSCGGLHTIVVTKDQQVFAFGDGGDGQLGLGLANMNNVLVPELVKIPEVAIATA